MALFGIYTTNKEKRRIEEAKRKSELESMLKRQNGFGQSLYAELSNAASENTRVNILTDGRKAENIGEIDVVSIPDNGGKYSVVVGVPDPTCFTGYYGRRGYGVLQVNIDAKKNHLHVFECPYGPHKDYDLSSFEEVKRKLSDYVKRFTMFPRENEENNLFRRELKNEN